MKKNNSKKAYQLVKDLTSTKKVRTSTIQNKDGKSLTEDQDILKRWTEYCLELYNYTATGDSGVLQVPTATSNDNYPILREEVEAAVKSLKKGKSSGIDNIPGELVQAWGEASCDITAVFDLLRDTAVTFIQKNCSVRFGFFRDTRKISFGHFIY